MTPTRRNKDTSPENWLVVVLDDDDKPVGEALVAGDQLVVTCAHVVNAALGRPFREAGHPGKVHVNVRFPFSGRPDEEVVRRFTVSGWLPSDPETFDDRDMASLHLNESMPSGVAVPTLVPAHYEGGPVMIFGPEAGPGKTRAYGYVKGEILGKRDKARQQLDQDIAGTFRARGGFSGGPVWIRSTNQVVGLVQAISTSQAAVDVYVLSAELIELASEGALYQVRDCPYVGLRSYRLEDADLFFGRNDFIGTLLETAKMDSLLIVTGISGYGKSSVVRAGLVPRLAQMVKLAIGFCELSESPFEELVGALARAAGYQEQVPPDIFELLRSKLRDEGLAACAAYVCSVTQTDRTLLVLDQFERIDNCRNPAVKAEFMAMLGDLLEIPLGRVQLVLIVRSDFHHKFALIDGPLGGHFQTSAKWLRQVSRAGLREAITGPVRAATMNVEFEGNLVDQICDDFQGSELPHLQIVLTRLWERQVGHRLTHKAYRELGGVADALAHYAEDSLDQLGAGRLQAAQRILTRLVLPDTNDIAHQVKRSDLRPDDWPVAEELCKLRLVTIKESQTSPDEEVVEIAHEALLRKWKRLRDWLGSGAELRRWRAATEARRDTWLGHDRDPAELLGGALLAQAQEMRARFPEDVTGLSDFIKASEDAAAQAELERRRAVERAEAVRLAGQSEYAINSAPARLPVALALGVCAMRRHEIFEADFAIRRALAIAGRQRFKLTHDDVVRSVAFSPDSSLIATASSDCTCLIWDLTRNVEVARLPHTDRVASVAFNPEGNRVATAGADGLVRIWDFRRRTQTKLLEHDGAVSAIAFSRDGQMIATAGNDRTVRVSELAGEPRTLEHKGRVTAVAFCPGKEQLVTASDDGGVRLWNARTGNLQAHWQNDGPVRAVTFRHDGSQFATASADGTARIYDPASHEELHCLKHQDMVAAVAFSPDGRYLATANEDGTARVWNVRIGFEVAHLIHRGQVGSVHFNPDGTRLATASRDGTARIWDVATGNEVARLVHESDVYQATFAPNGGAIATASDDGTARVWHVTAGAETLTLCHGEPINAIAFSGAGDLVATAGGGSGGAAAHDETESRTVRIWHARTGAQVVDPLRHPQGVDRIAFGGSMIATACDDNYARLWDLRDGTQIASIAHGGPVRSVAFDPEAAVLATASNDSTARIWDIRSKTEIAVLDHDDWVGAAVFSPDGMLLATAADNKVACLWNVAEYLKGAARPEPIRLRHESAVKEVVFDPVGHRVATVANDGITRIWDTETGDNLLSVSHGSRGRAAFSPDGSLIATAGEDGTARVWHATRGGDPIAHFVHEPMVRSVSFNKDGSQLATVGEDGSARIWSLQERKEVTRLLHGGEHLVMAFSPDGLRLATGSEEGIGRVWMLSRDELINQARDRLTRNLTRAEWNRYLPEIPYEKLRDDLDDPAEAWAFRRHGGVAGHAWGTR